jgi:hypothetical protein
VLHRSAEIQHDAPPGLVIGIRRGVATDAETEAQAFARSLARCRLTKPSG